MTKMFFRKTEMVILSLFVHKSFFWAGFVDAGAINEATINAKHMCGKLTFRAQTRYTSMMRRSHDPGNIL